MRLEDLVPTKQVKSLEKIEESVPENQLLPDYLLTDPEVVGYPDLEMQENIYEYALMGVLPLVLDPVSPIAVVDIGAGRGDLRAYLERRYNGSLVGLDYFGYELNFIHVTAAKQKYGIEILVSDFANIEYNFKGWGFCIGSLNDDYGLFPPDSPREKFEYFRKLLDSCLRNISDGTVFILLNETDENQPNLIPFPISEMVEFLDSEYTDVAYNLDYSRFQGIYKLIIYNQRLQS